MHGLDRSDQDDHQRNVAPRNTVKGLEDKSVDRNPKKTTQEHEDNLKRRMSGRRHWKL